MAWANCWEAEAISWEWNPLETASRTALNPISARVAAAAWAGSSSPAITVWAGELKFTGSTYPGVCSQTWPTVPSSLPRMANMAPGFWSAACCMAAARAPISRKPSSRVQAPAMVRAAYSPKEWPATAAGSHSWRAASQAAMEQAKMAGWETAVRPSSSSVPSKLTLARSTPKISPPHS